jgi:hypothetical protein
MEMALGDATTATDLALDEAAGRAFRASRREASNPENESMTRTTVQIFLATAAAYNVVTVPVSALHQGYGRTGGRSGSWTPNQAHASAAQPILNDQLAGPDGEAERLAKSEPGCRPRRLEPSSPLRRSQ